MHSEPTQNPDPRPANSSPRPAQLTRPSTWPTNPPLRINCDTSQPATSQPPPKCTCTKVNPEEPKTKPRTNPQSHPQKKASRQPHVRQSAARGARGVVPPD